MIRPLLILLWLKDSFLLDNDEPQPHLPVTAMSSKHGPEGLTAAKPAQPSAPNTAGLSTVEPPAGGAGENTSIKGQPAVFYSVPVCTNKASVCL